MLVEKMFNLVLQIMKEDNRRTVNKLSDAWGTCEQMHKILVKIWTYEKLTACWMQRLWAIDQKYIRFTTENHGIPKVNSHRSEVRIFYSYNLAIT